MNLPFFYYRSKEWIPHGPGILEWGGLNTDVETLLQKYRRGYSKFVMTWDGEGDGTYFEDWSDYLSDEPFDGRYDSDTDQGRHAEFIEGLQTAERIQRAALLASEHTRFMAWLAEKEKMELYEEFEGVIRKEHSDGKYPGAPVRDLTITN